MVNSCCGSPGTATVYEETGGGTTTHGCLSVQRNNLSVDEGTATATGQSSSHESKCCDSDDKGETNDCGGQSCCREATSDNGSPASTTSACEDGCCNASPEYSNVRADPDAPDCCRGKSSPCCDDSCLERLALRECSMHEKGAVVGTSSFPCYPEKDSSSGARTVACDGHRKSARERHGLTLETIGCICRALLALGQESCCESRKRPSTGKRTAAKKCSTQSAVRSVEDSCCSSGRAEVLVASGTRTRTRKAARARLDDASIDSCCRGGSCSEREKVGASSGSCAETTSRPKTAPRKDGLARSPIKDPESQDAGEEHVVLGISGMTCTGCETKLNRTLANVSGVKNLKTSLVLSRAEFDVDLRLTTVDKIIKHLERTTEFKCEKLAGHGASLDVLVQGDAAVFANRRWPDGVLDMSPLSSNTLRLTFDPAIIGARDLLAELGPNVSLAPVCVDASLEAGGKHVRNVGYITLASALLTIPVLVIAWAPLPERELAYASSSLALATLVQVFIAGPFYPKALKALVFSRVVEMDLLIVLSTSAAYAFSVVSFGYLAAGKPLPAGQFFETSTLLVTLIMVGRYVAALARQKAVESISIRSLQAQTALVVGPGISGEREIDVRLLQHGDVFKVLPDTKIPTDGTIISGSSEVDESLITGEHLPVEKHVKSQIIAGTVNGSGVLVARLNRLPGDNTLNTIAAMVDEAKLSKPRMQAIADKVASWFVPVVVALTIVTFVAWVSMGVAVQGKTGSESAVQAITYAIAVLIVSCPCAIGLAVPMVVVIASGVAAERGVIYKTAAAIEVAHKASHVVFDKTGTLTQGKLKVIAEYVPDESKDYLPLLMGLVAHSRHPISEAMKAYLTSKGITASESPNVKSLVGQGLEANVGDCIIRAGNSRWLNVAGHVQVQQMLGQGRTVFCFTIDGKLKAVYGLEDSLRADASDTVQVLRRRGISLHLLSGDDDEAVQSVATKLGIPHDKVRSRSSPGDKQEYMKALISAKPGGAAPVVVFCGDGTNDAVALAQATVGVHMNHGASDVARCAADAVLLRPGLAGVLVLLDTSRRAMRRVRFNFAWSFVYNALAVLLAAGALVRARIPPQFAGLGELVSVLPVVAAAVLLRWPRPA